MMTNSKYIMKDYLPILLIIGAMLGTLLGCIVLFTVTMGGVVLKIDIHSLSPTK